MEGAFAGDGGCVVWRVDGSAEMRTPLSPLGVPPLGSLISSERSPRKMLAPIYVLIMCWALR